MISAEKMSSLSQLEVGGEAFERLQRVWSDDADSQKERDDIIIL